jgi:hypothetical protein
MARKTANEPEGEAPTGKLTALSQIANLLQAAETEVQESLEAALAGIEEAIDEYLSVVRLTGKHPHESDALRDAGARLHALIGRIGNNESLRPTAAPRAARKTRTDAAGGWSSSGGRRGKPPSAVVQRATELLGEHPAGLPAGTIIERLQATDAEKTSLRNWLSSGKRSGLLDYVDSTKAYKLAPKKPEEKAA